MIIQVGFNKIQPNVQLADDLRWCLHTSGGSLHATTKLSFLGCTWMQWYAMICNDKHKFSPKTNYTHLWCVLVVLANWSTTPQLTDASFISTGPDPRRSHESILTSHPVRYSTSQSALDASTSSASPRHVWIHHVITCPLSSNSSIEYL